MCVDPLHRNIMVECQSRVVLSYFGVHNILNSLTCTSHGFKELRNHNAHTKGPS